MDWLWAVLRNAQYRAEPSYWSEPWHCCGSENDVRIFYSCLSPHFHFPFQSTSLTVAVYSQAVKGTVHAHFLCSTLAQCVNVKSVQSVLMALLRPRWSMVFELAAQPLLLASTHHALQNLPQQQSSSWYTRRKGTIIHFDDMGPEDLCHHLTNSKPNQ